jgi:hypothetical protein
MAAQIKLELKNAVLFYTKHFNYDNEVCTICCEKLDSYNNVIYIGECGHMFHKKCISDTCPIDNNPFIIANKIDLMFI